MLKTYPGFRLSAREKPLYSNKGSHFVRSRFTKHGQDSFKCKHTAEWRLKSVSHTSDGAEEWSVFCDVHRLNRTFNVSHWNQGETNASKKLVSLLGLIAKVSSQQNSRTTCSQNGIFFISKLQISKIWKWSTVIENWQSSTRVCKQNLFFFYMHNQIWTIDQ